MKAYLNFIYRKMRTVLSRVFVIGVLVTVVVSSSGWESREWIAMLMTLAGLLLVGVATVGRMWCLLYISGYKSETLVTAGPYSLSRNPLYFFSLLGGLGVGLCSETLTIPAVILAVFVLYYPIVIRWEEEKLRMKHPKEYAEYCRITPRFFPKFSGFQEPALYEVKPVQFRKRLFDGLGFIWMAGLVGTLEDLHELDILVSYFQLY